jgi:2-polyprenyl-3-methyl-5-hydroxy-6-metoxy-1,4-benzoquinol methylase
MTVIENVRAYYNGNVQREWERLDRHPFEFAVTKHYLDRYIRPGDAVLDIGGGPGRYSIELAERGCGVTLLDLSDENVAYAGNKAAERGLPLRAVQGDARTADRLITGLFDHVLLMGPMYHLLEEAERAEAVHAALKLLKPGGLLFVSFISLNAGIIYFLGRDPQGVLDEREQAYLDCYLKNETYSGASFTEACFIAPREIRPFMERFGLNTCHLFGQESITIPGEQNILACGRAVADRWTALAIAVCEREEFLSQAAHLMYIGRRL